MALRNGSSGEISMVDLAMNIVAFESMNKCRIVLTLTVTDNKGRGDVMVQATAYDRQLDPAEAPSLGSVNVSCLSTRLLTLDAALIHALYILDGEIARRELS